MKRLATVSIVALTLSVAHAERALATADAELPSRVVNFSDLDLSKPAAAAALYSRIEFAASSVCDARAGYGLANAARWRQCVKSSVARAVAEVHAPLLTAYHLARTNGQIVAPAAARLNH
jgi:UrcA family protein